MLNAAIAESIKDGSMDKHAMKWLGKRRSSKPFRVVRAAIIGSPPDSYPEC